MDTATSRRKQEHFFDIAKTSKSKSPRILPRSALRSPVVLVDDRPPPRSIFKRGPASGLYRSYLKQSETSVETRQAGDVRAGRLLEVLLEAEQVVKVLRMWSHYE